MCGRDEDDRQLCEYAVDMGCGYSSLSTARREVGAMDGVADTSIATAALLHLLGEDSYSGERRLAKWTTTERSAASAA